MSLSAYMPYAILYLKGAVSACLGGGLTALAQLASTGALPSTRSQWAMVVAGAASSGAAYFKTPYPTGAPHA